MDIFVTFENRQLIVGEIRSESNVESVGVHADGKNPESVAIALMTAIECLVIEPIDIVYWLVQNLPNKEQKDIKRSIVCEIGEDQDAVEIAVEAVGRLDRDEQQKIATDILGRWGEDSVESYADQPESEESDAAM